MSIEAPKGVSKYECLNVLWRCTPQNHFSWVQRFEKGVIESDAAFLRRFEYRELNVDFSKFPIVRLNNGQPLTDQFKKCVKKQFIQRSGDSI